jgi:hypothetical protein
MSDAMKVTKYYDKIVDEIIKKNSAADRQLIFNAFASRVGALKNSSNQDLEKFSGDLFFKLKNIYGNISDEMQRVIDTGEKPEGVKIHFGTDDNNEIDKAMEALFKDVEAELNKKPEVVTPEADSFDNLSLNFPTGPVEEIANPFLTADEPAAAPVKPAVNTATPQQTEPKMPRKSAAKRPPVFGMPGKPPVIPGKSPLIPRQAPPPPKAPQNPLPAPKTVVAEKSAGEPQQKPLLKRKNTTIPLPSIKQPPAPPPKSEGVRTAAPTIPPSLAMPLSKDSPQVTASSNPTVVVPEVQTEARATEPLKSQILPDKQPKILPEQQKSVGLSESPKMIDLPQRPEFVQQDEDLLIEDIREKATEFRNTISNIMNRMSDVGLDSEKKRMQSYILEGLNSSNGVKLPDEFKTQLLKELNWKKDENKAPILKHPTYKIDEIDKLMKNIIEIAIKQNISKNIVFYEQNRTTVRHTSPMYKALEFMDLNRGQRRARQAKNLTNICSGVNDNNKDINTAIEDIKEIQKEIITKEGKKQSAKSELYILCENIIKDFGRILELKNPERESSKSKGSRLD